MSNKVKNITERVQSFEDALAVTGRPNLPDFSNVPEDLRDYFEGQYMAIVVTVALNEGWEADWKNPEQEKYFPWFHHHPESSSGFVFDVTFCRYSNAHAGNGSRICFKNPEITEYAGKQFIHIWNKILLSDNKKENK